MGLEITVGVLAGETDEEETADLREELDGLSAALAGTGVQWREPDAPPVHTSRAPLLGFPYSWLHELRRVYALDRQDLPITPRGERGMTSRDRDAIDDEASMLDSHLLCHSDCEGYYVPVAFDEPLFLPSDAGVAGGGMVGSSQGLLDELRGCAPALGITLDGGELSDDEARRVGDLPETDPFMVEASVWLTLHEACRASIAGGHAIVFQ
ncbi:hypothetical protein AB0K00_30090 [Dactylosporangium sp. NPDC049525]|uniref:hypothetical protein n=1 Tax=Dactylosporangium sp. NPDC049525 TaxID=3154730 RepID=UPI00343BBB4A